MFADLDLLDPRHIELVDEAIGDGRVGFAVQQVCSASDPNEILYGECLARLTGPDGRIYSAREFVPCLEAMGEAPLIDQHMLGLVLRQLDHDPDAILGCNLSADNLGDQAMWDGILEQVRSYSHLALRLVLELTEAQPVPSLTFASDMIAEIRELGCRVALDDFVAGFASPRLVQLIDFDIIKIDKGLVHDIRPSADGRNSLQNIVGFASSFAPIVVAEGVETRAQANAARDAGATHIQGYFLSTLHVAGEIAPPARGGTAS